MVADLLHRGGGEMDDVAALALQCSTNAQGLAPLVDAAQEPSFLEPLAQRLGGEGDAVADLLAEALHGRKGGIGLQIEVLAVHPPDALAFGRPASPGCARCACRRSWG